MTLTERIDSVYEEMNTRGIAIKVEGEDNKYRAFTKADARAVVEAEDARAEGSFLNGGDYKTSYGILKIAKRAARDERPGRNPATKEIITIPAQPAYKTLKISVGSKFYSKLNPESEAE